MNDGLERMGAAHPAILEGNATATGQIFVRRLHPPGEYRQSKHESDECASASIMPCCGSGASGGSSILKTLNR
jgi:hypothetical protein